MRTIKIKPLILGLLSAVTIYSFASCSRKINFETSSVVPAARGFVKVNKDHNKNYVIQVTISDLAEVNRLQPPKQVYVVWMISNDGILKNLGKINSSAGSFSQTLKASFETVSATQPAKVFITAEDDPAVTVPGNLTVLSTDTF